MNTWSNEDLAAIGTAGELQASTQHPDRTFSRPVTIWVVRVGGDLYCPLGIRRDQPLVSPSQRRPTGRVRAAGLDRIVDFEPADSSLAAAIDAAYRAKYHRYGPNILDPMASPTAALRLIPHVS
jgi:hypothetical protein